MLLNIKNGRKLICLVAYSDFTKQDTTHTILSTFLTILQKSNHTWRNSNNPSFPYIKTISSYYFSDLTSLITLPLLVTCELCPTKLQFNFIFPDLSTQIQPNWLNPFLLWVSKELCSYCAIEHFKYDTVCMFCCYQI